MTALDSFFLCFVGIVCLWCFCTADKIPPQFEMKLDLPPRERWQEIYKELMGRDEVAQTMSRLVHAGYDDIVGGGCDEKCVYRLNSAYKMRFPDYYEELAGIAEVGKLLNLTVEMLVVQQAKYELSILNLLDSHGVKNEMDDLDLPLMGIGCTSVLTCDANNDVLHGRNLDWSNAQILASMMFRVNVTRNGKLLFQSDQIAGHVGVLTASHPDGFSMSLNARRLQVNPNMEQFLKCVENVPLQPILTGVRYYIENFNSYEDVVQNLTQTPYCAPRYTIVGGLKGKGARFQHNLGNVYEAYEVHIDKDELQCSNDSWFVAQCNSDFDVVPTNETDPRRYTIINELNSETRSYACTSVGLFRAMTVPKVKNANTVHTTVMSPKNGEIVTVAYDI